MRLVGGRTRIVGPEKYKLVRDKDKMRKRRDEKYKNISSLKEIVENRMMSKYILN